jgi:hypothetical protein
MRAALKAVVKGRNEDGEVSFDELAERVGRRSAG